MEVGRIPARPEQPVEREAPGVSPSSSASASPMTPSSTSSPTAAATASLIRLAALPVGAANATEGRRSPSPAARWVAASSRATV